MLDAPAVVPAWCRIGRCGKEIWLMDKKEPKSRGATAPAAGGSRDRLVSLGSIVGIGGTLVCSLSMVAVAVGLFVAGGTAAAQGGMAGMGSGHQGMADVPGWLEALLRFGPVILIVSVLLVAASVTLRRRLAALPAISGGLILYVGMYAQPNLALMYAAIVVGTVLLVVAYGASLRPTTKEVGRRAM